MVACTLPYHALHKRIYSTNRCVRWRLGRVLLSTEVTPIIYWSRLGNRASVRVRFYGYV